MPEADGFSRNETIEITRAFPEQLQQGKPAQVPCFANEANIPSND